jgi:hypothetical protein
LVTPASISCSLQMNFLTIVACTKGQCNRVKSASDEGGKTEVVPARRHARAYVGWYLSTCVHPVLPPTETHLTTCVGGSTLALADWPANKAGRRDRHSPVA